MNEKIILLFAFVLCSLIAHAQKELSDQITFSLYSSFGIPSPQLKKAVDNPIGGTAIGLGTNLLFKLKKEAPVSLGIDFSYMTFGRDKTGSTSNAPPYKTSFNYYTVGGLFRLTPLRREHGFTPFVDGLMGLKIFNTRTKIDKDLWAAVIGDDEPEVIHTTNDTGLAYGIGLGWYIRKPKEGLNHPAFTMRAMYLWGDNTSYVKRGSLTVDSGQVNFETGYTETSLFMIQLGIIIY